MIEIKYHTDEIPEDLFNFKLHHDSKFHGVIYRYIFENITEFKKHIIFTPDSLILKYQNNLISYPLSESFKHKIIHEAGMNGLYRGQSINQSEVLILINPVLQFNDCKIEIRNFRQSFSKDKYSKEYIGLQCPECESFNVSEPSIIFCKDCDKLTGHYCKDCNISYTKQLNGRQHLCNNTNKNIQLTHNNVFTQDINKVLLNSIIEYKEFIHLICLDINNVDYFKVISLDFTKRIDYFVIITIEWYYKNEHIICELSCHTDNKKIWIGQYYYPKTGNRFGNINEVIKALEIEV